MPNSSFILSLKNTWVQSILHIFDEKSLEKL